MKQFGAVLGFLTLSTSILIGQARNNPSSRNYPPELPGATAEVYKTIGDVQLKISIYSPRDHQTSDRRPAVVFFFGGAWRNGTPSQFRRYCEYLASRGMVAMSADYRVSSRHGTKAVKCVADGKSAIRWVRRNFQRLGVDPNRVVAGGGSAGGHVAACAGVIAGMDEAGEDLSISSRPDALVLFNPASVMAPVEGKPAFDPQRLASLEDRMGVAPKALSPFHHVRPGRPPTLP